MQVVFLFLHLIVCICVYLCFFLWCFSNVHVAPLPPSIRVRVGIAKVLPSFAQPRLRLVSNLECWKLLNALWMHGCLCRWYARVGLQPPAMPRGNPQVIYPPSLVFQLLGCTHPCYTLAKENKPDGNRSFCLWKPHIVTKMTAKAKLRQMSNRVPN